MVKPSLSSLAIMSLPWASAVSTSGGRTGSQCSSAEYVNKYAGGQRSGRDYRTNCRNKRHGEFLRRVLVQTE